MVALKRFQGIRFSQGATLAALLALQLLMSCQSTPAVPPTSAPLSPQRALAASSVSQPLMPNQDQAFPRGAVMQTAEAAGVLRFEMEYPGAFLNAALAKQQARFDAQVLDYANFVRFQVSVVGIGMTPLYPAVADAEQNHTIAAAGCSQVAGCTVDATITDVPSGENRVALVQAYDAAGDLISGSTLAAVFTLPEGTEPYTVQLSYRSNPLAELARQFLGESADHLLLSQLDPVAGQQFMDQVMGATGTFPDFDYVTHPALVNVAQIATDLKAQAGDFSALNPAEPTYTHAGGTVSGSISGLVASDKVTLRLSDPATGALIDQSNSNFSFTQIPAGTWKLAVDAPAGYTVSGVPNEVVVTEGGSVTNVNVVLTPTQPVLTSISQPQGAPGQVITLTGTHFHPSAEGNTVKVGTTVVPSSAIEVVSDTELKVTLPQGLMPGASQISVAVGTEEAVNTPAFQVLLAGPTQVTADNISTSGYDLSWDAVPNATGYNVYRDGVLVQSDVPNPSYTMTGLDPATGSDIEVSALVDGSETVKSPVLRVFTLSNWTTWSALGPSTENVLAATAHVNVTDTVFFGSQVGGASLGGIWRCVNTTCVQKADSTVAGSVQALAVSPQNATTIYAGSQTLGVLKSTDNGENWIAVNTGLPPAALNVRTLLLDPQREGHIYAGTQGAGVYMSTDGGQNWQAVNQGFVDVPTPNVGALSLYQPDTGPPTIFLGSKGIGVYKSVGGDPAQINWQSINDGLPAFFGTVIFQLVDVVVMEPHPTKPTFQYGAATGACNLPVFCTGDSGLNYEPGVWRREDPNNWLQLGHDGLREYDPQANSPDVSTGLTNMQVFDLVFDPSNSEALYAATGDGVYRSTDEGFSWSKYDAGLPGSVEAHVLAMHPAKLFLGTNQGLYLAN